MSVLDKHSGGGAGRFHNQQGERNMKCIVGKKEIKQGDKIKDFRGETWVFVCATRPNSDGKAGKVHAQKGNCKQEFYASVFGGVVVED